MSATLKGKGKKAVERKWGEQEGFHRPGKRIPEGRGKEVV